MLQFFRKIKRLFIRISKLVLITSFIAFCIQPLKPVDAQTHGSTSSSGSSPSSQSILGNLLPACNSVSTGVNSLLECFKQATITVLVIGIIFVFIKVAYESASGLLSGGTSAANIEQIKNLLGSLIVGLVLVGMPALIMQSIDPLAGRVGFNFLQQLNLGPEARLVPVDLSLQATGCFGLQMCINRSCTQPGNIENCVRECIRKNTESGDLCNCTLEEGNVNVNKFIEKYINSSGQTTQKFSKECLNPPVSEPPAPQINVYYQGEESNSTIVTNP